MNIAIIGLGLIGGSMAKALCKRTQHRIFGYDRNQDVLKKALCDNAISEILDNTSLDAIDTFIICLHPEAEISFILDNADRFSSGCMIIDTCGIKTAVYDSVYDILSKKNIDFIGCHPMAGREFSGYDYSLETLFDKASFIIAPEKNQSAEKIDKIKKLAHQIGFKKIIMSTPDSHDQTIAYTSQLAHIASNAYIKSPQLKNENGFTGGSFQDMTRVARLNEDMWTDLFIMNKEPLLFELDTYIENLKKYSEALKNDDKDTLKELLREGRLLKESISD